MTNLDENGMDGWKIQIIDENQHVDEKWLNKKCLYHATSLDWS
jgi:hypothetical protein